MTITGRVETLESQVSTLNQAILQRPDIVSYQAYQIGHQQELDSIGVSIDEFKLRLRNLNGLYATLFQTVSNNTTAYTGHTGDATLHSIKNANRVITGDATLAVTDRVISFNQTGSNITATLPSVSLASGNFYWFNKVDAGSYTGIITGAANINGAGSTGLATRYSSLTLYSNGSVWYTF